MDAVAGCGVEMLLVWSRWKFAVLTRISLKDFREKMDEDRSSRLEKRSRDSPVRRQREKRRMDVFDPY